MSIKGIETRARILREALNQVTKIGFEGLTLGPLAEQLGLSKSGLFAHFGSREELQLAALELAAEDFRKAVLEPVVHTTPRGLRRLLTVLRHWFNRYPQEGCVFLAGSAEYDDRPGEMRDALAEFHSQWRGALATTLRQCQEVGDLDQDMDVDQVAFELFAIAAGGHHDYRLFGREAGKRAKIAVERLLRSCGAAPEKLIWK